MANSAGTLYSLSAAIAESRELDFPEAREVILRASSRKTSLDKRALEQAKKILSERDASVSFRRGFLPAMDNKDIKKESQNSKRPQGDLRLTVITPKNVVKLPSGFGLNNLRPLKVSSEVSGISKKSSSKSNENRPQGSVKLPLINSKA
jgi:hypothetical protein